MTTTYRVTESQKFRVEADMMKLITGEECKSLSCHQPDQTNHLLFYRHQQRQTRNLRKFCQAQRKQAVCKSTPRGSASEVQDVFTKVDLREPDGGVSLADTVAQGCDGEVLVIVGVRRSEVCSKGA